MLSVELNAAIIDICDKKRVPYKAFGGKCIPYIGWFWRRVNFDIPFTLGVMPPAEALDIHGVALEPERMVYTAGFMENNKWDYFEFEPSAEDCAAVRALLETAVIEPTEANLRAVNEKIQSLIPLDAAAAHVSEY